MFRLTPSQVASIVNGKLIVNSQDNLQTFFESPIIDSRQVQKNDLFIAIKGDNNDGHQFLEQVLNLGALGAIVEEEADLPLLQIKVDYTFEALEKLAAWHRNNTQAKVIAITGSCGKTTIKEMLASILKQDHCVCTTKGNLNNHFGVPLTLLSLKETDEFLVVEIGANHLGEIDAITAFVRPHIAMIVNISPAHLEGFGSLENIAKAKREIFLNITENGVCFFPETIGFKPLLLEVLTTKKVIEIKEKGPYFSTERLQNKQQKVNFLFKYQAQEQALMLPILGEHQFHNALCALSVACYLNISFQAIVKGFAQLTLPFGRMEEIQIGKLLFINDSYNASVDSVISAINTLESLGGLKVLVLGDLSELGESKLEVYQLLAAHLSQAKIDLCLTLGEDMRLIQIPKIQHFDKHDILTQALIEFAESKNQAISILLKGSRRMRLEEILEQINQKRDQLC